MNTCDGTLVAVAAANGAVAWQGEWAASRAPLLGYDAAAGAVLAAGTAGIAAFAGSDGALQWQWQSGAANASFSLSTDGRLYASAATVFALSTQGAPAWNLSVAAGAAVPCAAPVVGVQGAVYVACSDSTLYAVASLAPPLPWSQRGHDNSMTFRSPNVGARGPAVVATAVVQTGGAVQSSPAIDVSGTVFVGSDDGNLYAASGGTQWVCYAVGSPILSSPALSGGGLVYVGADDARLYAVYTANCTLAWSWTAAAKIRTSVVLGADGGTVYIQTASGTTAGVVTALNGTDGSVLWQFPFAWDGTSQTLAFGNNSVLLVDAASNLYALQPESGAVVGSATSMPGIHGARAVAVQRASIYVGSAGALSSFNISSNSVSWTVLYANLVPAVAVGPSGTIVAVSSQSICASTATGGWLWTTPANCTVLASPAIDAAGTVYAGCNSGDIFALDGKTAAALWRVSTSMSVQSSPAIGADGTVYIGSNDGNLHAVTDAGGAALA